MWLYYRVISPNNADGMANSVDPDQTAPLGAVWSGSALFAQAYLSENLGSLWYCHYLLNIHPVMKVKLLQVLDQILILIWATSQENLSSWYATWGMTRTGLLSYGD